MADAQTTRFSDDPERRVFVSRGGEKLDHALRVFGVDPAGLVCADLGCSTGGFTDALLQRGASKVFAVDTAYGELAWKLRNDPRVVVMERTNALHAEPPEKVDLVVIDLGWTRQDKALPTAAAWLKEGGRIITLVKPHYELETEELDRLAPGRVLPEEEAERVAMAVIESLRGEGWKIEGVTKSPILGGAGKKSRGKGNAEWLLLVRGAGSAGESC